MTPKRLPELKTTDPSMMRALAHPLRMEIMRLVDDMGEATATQIAERLGQTPANCSFHLRTLEKHGLVERGERRGTEKPWRRVHGRRQMTPDLADPASVESSRSLAIATVQHHAHTMTQFFTTAAASSSEWAEAVTITTSRFWATADELAALIDTVTKLTDAFDGRDDPALRPEGAVRSMLFATVHPEVPDSDVAGSAQSAE